MSQTEPQQPLEPALSLDAIREPASATPVVEDETEASVLEGDVRRTEETKAELHFIFIIALRIGAGALIALALVRVIHLILPENGADCWCHGWLTNEQVASLDKFFSSTALGAVIAHFSRLIFGKQKSEE